MADSSGSQLFAWLRDARGQRVLVSRYDPLHGDWSLPVDTNLPNPDAAVDVAATPGGRLLMVYNHSEVDRHRLDLATSVDGLHWQPIHTFKNEAGAAFSYPTLLRATDGDYHLVYSFKRQTIKHQHFDATCLWARLAESTALIIDNLDD